MSKKCHTPGSQPSHDTEESSHKDLHTVKILKIRTPKSCSKYQKLEQNHFTTDELAQKVQTK